MAAGWSRCSPRARSCACRPTAASRWLPPVACSIRPRASISMAGACSSPRRRSSRSKIPPRRRARHWSSWRSIDSVVAMPRAKSADEIGTLGFALLGLIAREPKSGYDLARHLERPLGDLWTAHLPQIYPELAKLQAAGLVKSRAVTQKSRPDKKIYSITKAGEAALADWVATPVKQTPVRRELMLKTFSVWLADRERAAALYRGEAEAAEQALARYQEKLGALAEQYGRG